MGIDESRYHLISHDVCERLDSLRAWALVCRAWRSTCQECLFAFVYLNNSTQLDRLCHTLRQPSSCHFAHCTQRIRVAYRPPFYKFGEALPRIVSMRLSNLVQIDIASYLSQNPIPFPLHPSILAQASQLQNIRYMQLSKLCFKHLAELRRFMSVFRGLESLLLDEISFGKDERGDLRSLHQTSGSGLRSLILIYGSGKPALKTTFLPYPWIAPLPNSGFSRRGLFQKTQKSYIIPVVSLSFAELSLGLLRTLPSRPLILHSWNWVLHSESGCQL